MSQEETSCHRKELPVTGRNFLSQKETSCHGEKILMINTQMDKEEEEIEIAENFPLLQNTYKIFKNAMNNHWKENSDQITQEDISFHRKKLPVTGRNFLSQEETYSQGKKFALTGRNLLSQ